MSVKNSIGCKAPGDLLDQISEYNALSECSGTGSSRAKESDKCCNRGEGNGRVTGRANTVMSALLGEAQLLERQEAGEHCLDPDCRCAPAPRCKATGSET